VCLRKWLYVQDNCPLCHKLIYVPENVTSETQENNNQDENHFEGMNPGAAAPNNTQDAVVQQPLNPVRERQDRLTVGARQERLNNGTFQPANSLRVHQD
jgi:hypothetical protein